MWGVVDDSAEEPWHELWGLFRPDGDVSWQHKALCAQTDPEAFFPEKGGSTRDAKRVCAKCEVREQCLKWAIDGVRARSCQDRKSTRLNSSHTALSRMPSSA